MDDIWIISWLNHHTAFDAMMPTPFGNLLNESHLKLLNPLGPGLGI